MQADHPAAQRNCAALKQGQMPRSPNEGRASDRGVVVSIAKIPSAFPLLDTLKVVHIWYTTITTHGWRVLEFNYSGLVIGARQSTLDLCLRSSFPPAGYAKLSVISTPTGELKNDRK